MSAPTNLTRMLQYMSELGRLLQEARTAKKLSLADAEQVTRIRQKYLEALENGSFFDLPRGTTARGLLRIYAAYLGLDVQGALDLYARESGDAGDDVAIAEPGSPRLTDYRPLEVDLMGGALLRRWLPWAGAVLLVAALVGGIIWGALRDRDAEAEPTAVALATATSVTTAASVAATATPTSPPAATPTSDLLPLPTPTVRPSITPTQRPTSTPETVARITVDLRTTQRAWMRVTVDGTLAEEGVLEANATRTWEADSSIIVRTGNGGGVELTVNGEEQGRMGAASQVVERTWVVQDGQVIEGASGTPVAAATRAPSSTPTPTPAG